MKLSSATVLLTGATGGIGNEIAQQLVSQGAHVIAVGRSQQSLDHLGNIDWDNKKENCGNITALQADLSQKEGRDKVISFCFSLPKGIDVLINNAGINQFGLFSELAEEEIEQIIKVNTLIPMLLCKDLIPLLEKKPISNIVNIGSTFGSIGFAGFVAYSTSKFALRGFSEALRRELAETGISVNYVAPRATQTDFNSSSITAMNQQLGNTMDSPVLVAKSIVETITNNTHREYFLGWPEKLFVKLNALLPKAVDKALLKKLKIIRKYASNQSSV